MKNKRRLRDAVLFFLLLSVSLAACLWPRGGAGSCREVVVYVEGTEVFRQDLETDGSYRIAGVGGENLLIIRDGEAYIGDSDCPRHICESQGKISGEGETIVCLPHRVYIEIREEES